MQALYRVVTIRNQFGSNSTITADGVSIYKYYVRKGAIGMIPNAPIMERCRTANPEKELADYNAMYSNQDRWPDHYVAYALGCLLPRYRGENQDNSGWDDTTPEEIFGDWRLDNHSSCAA
jgi:hypothetical protein